MVHMLIAQLGLALITAQLSQCSMLITKLILASLVALHHTIFMLITAPILAFLTAQMELSLILFRELANQFVQQATMVLTIV
jgi:hypothetical protein